MAATPSVLAVVLGHNRSKARVMQVVLGHEEAAEHMCAPGAVRCPLPHLLGMPLVMVPLGEDLRLPNKAATYLLAAPATGTPPYSVGGSVLVLRADCRDFPLREYQRWWAFLSGTLLPLYVVRTDDRDRAAVLDRCAPACLRFVAGLEDGARAETQRAPAAPAPASSAAPKPCAPGTPCSVLPDRRSFSSPDSPLSPCFSPTSPDSARGAAPPPLREAAARAWASRVDLGDPGAPGGPKCRRDSGEWAAGRGPVQAACCSDAAWFRERLAANCIV